jgi:hypothetical protein
METVERAKKLIFLFLRGIGATNQIRICEGTMH